MTRAPSKSDWHPASWQGKTAATEAKKIYLATIGKRVLAVDGVGGAGQRRRAQGRLVEARAAVHEAAVVAVDQTEVRQIGREKRRRELHGAPLQLVAGERADGVEVGSEQSDVDHDHEATGRRRPHFRRFRRA